MKLDTVCGNGELRDSVINIVNFARNNFGAGASSYTLYNAGTKKKPMEYITVEVTLDDLVSWAGGKDKLSDSLKKEIMSTKFTRVTVIIDKDKEVE